MSGPPPSLLRLLDEQAIPYLRCDHPAVYTVEEADRLVPKLPGIKTKNLFVRDKKDRRRFLVVVPHHHRVDLKTLGAILDAGPLALCSAARLEECLALGPGSVSILAVFADQARRVSLVVDTRVWAADAVQAHPMVNTSTLVVPKELLGRFLLATGHEARLVDVPAVGERTVP